MSWERLTANVTEKGLLAALAALIMQSELARIATILLAVMCLQVIAMLVLHYMFGTPPAKAGAYREAAGTACLYLLFTMTAILLASAWPEWQPVAKAGAYFFLGVEGYELLRLLGMKIKLPTLPARREEGRP